MTTEKEYKSELERFERSWDIIKHKTPWLYQHYTDPRNRGNEGRIETRTDLIVIDAHLKEMQAICDNWKRNFV